MDEKRIKQIEQLHWPSWSGAGPIIKELIQALREARAENERLKKENYLRKRAIDNLPLCPDHRDKVHVLNICLVCENEHLRRLIKAGLEDKCE